MSRESAGRAAQRVLATVSLEEALALQLFECTRDRLASGAGHLAEKALGERKVERNAVAPDAPVLLRELHELASHAIDVVKARERDDRLRLLPHDVGERVDGRRG